MEQGAEFQETRMITKVKCVTVGCEMKDQVFTTTALFISKVAPLDGPFNCPKCEMPMKVVARVPANYKRNSGEKTPSRRIISTPTAKKSSIVGKKRKQKGIKIKTSGAFLGYKPLTKAAPKKPGQRKRGPSKS